MKLSVVIPAYNEAESISETILGIFHELDKEQIDHEILVVNDNSKDNTIEVLEALKLKCNSLAYITNQGPNGFGYAVRKGLDNFTGDCVAIMMADLSDSPQDLVKFYRKLVENNVDCVFGDRFTKESKVIDYPKFKLILNRAFNWVISLLFMLEYRDTTNAFKLFKKETIKGLRPLLSPHFNLTIELPLKAIIRGYSYEVVPNSWTNRKHGISKLNIKEMGSRYMFILLYCLLECYFSKGDYKRKDAKEKT